MAIRKISQTPPTMASIVDTYSTSEQDGYSCNYINNNLVYSTTEMDTGKIWTDGKKIYRKTITGNTPSSSGNLLYSDATINFIISANGMVRTQEQIELWTVIGGYTNNGEFNTIQFRKGYGIYWFGAYTLGTPFVLTIEYTKIS